MREIGLALPAIERYRGNTGIPWFTTLDSGRPGPHAVITALVHGNEIAGAIALIRLFETGFRPYQGRVTLGFANVAAFSRFDDKRPHLARYIDEDFNRVWDSAALDGRKRSVERNRAREIRPLIDQADYLLDLHSMSRVSAPMMMVGGCEKSLTLALALGQPELVIIDSGHETGLRLRDYGPFNDRRQRPIALLLEAGQHWQEKTAQTAFGVALAFLNLLGFTPPGFRTDTASTRHLAGPPRPQRIVEVTETVTVRSNSFAFVMPFSHLARIPTKGAVIANDGARAIVTPYDDCVLILPQSHFLRGHTAVRLGRYVT